MNAAGVRGGAAKKIAGSGSGDGQNSVGGLDLTGTDVEGTAHDFVDVEGVKADGGSDDIEDCVDRAHFVKVDFFNFDLVDPGFGFAEALEDLRGGGFDGRGERGVVDHAENYGEAAVMMVLVGCDFYVSGGDGTALYFFSGEAPAGKL